LANGTLLSILGLPGAPDPKYLLNNQKYVFVQSATYPAIHYYINPQSLSKVINALKKSLIRLTWSGLRWGLVAKTCLDNSTWWGLVA